ncbi:MAG: VOC family protein [Burkholderiaceae bacterium]|nr:VOC family protein [Burkholderiaceae bacterium]
MPEHSLPGLRGLDHIGFTVPDLQEAIRFFCDVMGCEVIYSRGALVRDDNWMLEHLNVHPRTVLKGVAFLRCGNGSNFELFEYEAPGQNRMQPANSDIGGHHLGFYVDDCDAAVAYLREQGLRLQGEPKFIASGPSAGQTWVYFLTPWDMQCELVSFPKGKAYERETHRHQWKTVETQDGTTPEQAIPAPTKDMTV